VTLTSVCMVRESSLCHGRSRAWDWLYIYTHRDTVGARLTIYMYTHTNTLGVNDLLHIYKHRHRHSRWLYALWVLSLSWPLSSVRLTMYIYTHRHNWCEQLTICIYKHRHRHSRRLVCSCRLWVVSLLCPLSREDTSVYRCTQVVTYQYVKRMSFQLFADMSHELYVHVRHDQLYVHVRRDVHVHIVGRDVRIHIIRDSHLRKV